MAGYKYKEDLIEFINFSFWILYSKITLLLQTAISKVKNGSHQSCQFKFVNFLNCQQRSNSGDILHVLEFRKSLSVVESFHEDFGEFLLLFLRLVLKKVENN